MTVETTFQILKDFLQERTEIPAENVTMDATLEELGIDSLTQLELLFEFEEKLGISLPDTDDRPKTIGDLVGFVETLIGTTPAQN
jgi:acyl carrier protein